MSFDLSMYKSISYICNKCNTLLHNNSCVCGNAAATVNVKGTVVKLYVDDITTVTPVDSYLNKLGYVCRLDFFSGLPDTVLIEQTLKTNRYRRVASNYFKNSQLTNMDTVRLFSK